MKKIEDLIRITEFGAAEHVPGSKLLLEIGKKDYLIDIGKDYQQKDEKLPFKAKNIDSLILTHGHADHMGELLQLYKEGFKGDIYSTRETVDITKLQLQQEVASVFIHNNIVKGKKYKYGPNKGKWMPFKKVKYTSKDIKKVMKMFESEDDRIGIPYETTIKVSDDVRRTAHLGERHPRANCSNLADIIELMLR